MKNTMDSMWRMVYEHGVKTIVMVTQLTERGKEKCRQYWPTVGKTATYGNVEVYLTEKIDKGQKSTSFYVKIYIRPIGQHYFLDAKWTG